MSYDERSYELWGEKTMTYFFKHKALKQPSTKLVHKEDGNYFVATATIHTQGNSRESVLQKYM